jgi:cytochrome c oxidase subunit 2
MNAQLGEKIALKTRTTRIWALALAALCVLGLPALAQDRPPAPTPEQQAGGWWLPEAAADYSWDADSLWRWIFVAVLGMFLITEGLLIVFCIIYRRRPGHRPTYTHGNTKAEITWTIVPAVMLVALAVIQIPAWNRIKAPDWKAKRAEAGAVNVDILGQQFKWNVRYPGTKAAFKTQNEYTNLSKVHTVLGATTVFSLRTSDVIHSVFIPAMRVKQDTVPGLRQSIWFRPNRFKLIDLKAPLVPDGKKFDGSPRMAQPFEWVSDEKEFGPGGKYYSKRIAVSAIQDYAVNPLRTLEDEGLYVPYKPGGKPKKVCVLTQGKVLQDEDGEGTEAWDSCDYALGIFEIACAELCGAEHHTMRAFLTVEPRICYEKWLEAQAKQDNDPAPIWKAWRQ